MKIRIQFWLPPVQISIALLHFVVNLHPPESVEFFAFSEVCRALCMGLNAPMVGVSMASGAVVHSWVETLRQFSYVANSDFVYLALTGIERAAFVVLVGVLWYAASLEFTGQGVSVLTPRIQMRKTVDGLAVACGVLLIRWGEWAFRISRISELRLGAVVSDILILSKVLEALLILLWGAAIVAFYAHDLWVAKGQERKPCHPKP